MSQAMKRIVIVLATVGMQISPLTSFSQETSNRTTSSGQRSQKIAGKTVHVFDVRMNESNQLVGAVVNAAGKPVVKTPIDIRLAKAKRDTADRSRSSVETDEHGVFRTQLPNGGLYQVTTNSGVTLVRVWTKKAAPPVAKDSILIVEGGDKIARGQRPIGSLFQVEDPVLLTTIVVAAVAIPVAVHNSRDDSKSGS
ncbi:MAG: hypothetical protein KDB27_04750 [Planctomycetales bacterium]|nr:hypothetical protein [Planctomycetales bacterium]